MTQAFHGGRWNEARTKFGRDQFTDFSVNTNAFWHPPALPHAVPAREAMIRYAEADAATITTLIASIHNIQNECILATAGAIEALYLATRLFSGKSAAIFHPSFADYQRACVAAGLTVKSIPLFPKRPPFLSVVEALADIAVVVLGHPNNPNGLLFQDLTELIEHPRLSKVSWIIDEAFIEFTPSHEKNSLIGKLGIYPNVLLLRALTKSWSIPGLRLGFVATTNQEWLQTLKALQPPWSIHGITELWAKENLNRTNYLAMLSSLRDLPSAREHFIQGVQSIKGLIPYPSDSNFFLIECTEQNAERLAASLGHSGFLVRVCHGFDGLDAKSYLRTAVRTRSENDELLRVLSDLTNTKPTKRQKHFPKSMRAISVLGTSSNSGKSWFATALCAWLRRRGLRVAPFKAQNMSNNSAVAIDGGEIGRAQAVQAEACGMAPSVRMNPILLKPSGASGSQLVRLGRAEGHIKAADYYKHIETLWPTVTESLAYWQDHCDVLVLEGAGSPVELNLMQRDLVNFRPVRHLDSRWLLVADIERGGVFAQAAGTWSLTPPEDQARCLGLVVNKFRGDLSLFSNAGDYFSSHFGAPMLGTLPFAERLQPENEDSLSIDPVPLKLGTAIHWIRLPHTSNNQDAHPWLLDEGVHVHWTSDPNELETACVIVLPGSKNTISDLRWLKSSGMFTAILQAQQKGALIIGICGGYQMLGQNVSDPDGLAGDPGEEAGLCFLPMATWFSKDKEVRNVEAIFQGERWNAYEIHMGRTQLTAHSEPLLQISDSTGPRDEGARHAKVWGTYLHGFFESREVRREIGQLACIQGHQVSLVHFRQQRERLYNDMADLLDEHLNMEDIWRYVAH
jgi:adenosylcobyric acid synthase